MKRAARGKLVSAASRAIAMKTVSTENMVRERLPDAPHNGEHEAEHEHDHLEEAHPGRQACCPFCGNVSSQIEAACAKCGLQNSTITRQATRGRLGPWYVMQARNPAAPGMNFATLMTLIQKGQITARSVIRGPTTQQLWRFAARVRGVSREFGLCYACGQGVERGAGMCKHCHRAQLPPINPNILVETREMRALAVNNQNGKTNGEALAAAIAQNAEIVGASAQAPAEELPPPPKAAVEKVEKTEDVEKVEKIERAEPVVDPTPMPVEKVEIVEKVERAEPVVDPTPAPAVPMPPAPAVAETAAEAGADALLVTPDENAGKAPAAPIAAGMPIVARPLESSGDAILSPKELAAAFSLDMPRAPRRGGAGAIDAIEKRDDAPIRRPSKKWRTSTAARATAAAVLVSIVIVCVWLGFDDTSRQRLVEWTGRRYDGVKEKLASPPAWNDPKPARNAPDAPLGLPSMARKAEEPVTVPAPSKQTSVAASGTKAPDAIKASQTTGARNGSPAPASAPAILKTPVVAKLPEKPQELTIPPKVENVPPPAAPKPAAPSNSSPVVSSSASPVEQARQLWRSAIDLEQRSDFAGAVKLYEQIKKLPRDAWPSSLDLRLEQARKQATPPSGK